MSNHSIIANSEQSASSLATPIEEKFWKRYSPHHELPLSSVSSIAVHALGIVAVIAFAVLAGEWSSRDSGKKYGQLARASRWDWRIGWDTR